MTVTKLRTLSALTLVIAGLPSGTDSRSTVAAEPAAINVEHFEPQPIRISVDDLPAPNAAESVTRHPQVVPPKPEFTLQAPPGFAVNVFADKVPQARWLAMTPEGDVLCSSGRTNQVFLLQDSDADGIADKRTVFVDAPRGANQPFGMDFARVDDQWYFYLGNTSAVLRYPYREGQVELGPDFEKITDLPGQGYNEHWTRNVRVAPSGDTLFVTVGSQTNVDPEQPPRACVLTMKLDGSGSAVFASGLRNPVGLDFHPVSHEPYVTVNERDELGDGLVPDYFTRIAQGQFFGWPYAYLTPRHLDPRRALGGKSERPDLVQATVTPDVLFEAHSAALGVAFAKGDKFPERYRRGAFSAFRGSWNRKPATGYKLVFVPFNESNRPEGYYEDFVRGFLLESQAPTTWGRPVGVLFAKDGSLLFTEESNGRIYRVSYPGT